MLTLYRRHRAKCKYTARRAKCSCPIWVQGILQGEKIRQSLDLTNWEAAQKKVRDWEIHGIKAVMSLPDAYDRFLAQHKVNDHAKVTIDKQRQLKRETVDFFGDVPLRSISVDDVARFRESWKVGPTTAKNRIERLRSFFKFCVERDWIEKNPAKPLKLPKVEEIERKPYEPDELLQIMQAVERFPKWGIYGEKNVDRVRAFVSVLRWTGMRISDAVQFSGEKIVDGQVILRTQKNGKRVSIPLHPDAGAALEKVKNGGDYFFWSGESTVKSAVADWCRTLKRLSKVANIHVTSHRFRHTLIVQLLSNGIPVSEVAAIAGNTPRVIERAYNQWIQGRQEALNAAVKAMW